MASKHSKTKVYVRFMFFCTSNYLLFCSTAHLLPPVNLGKLYYDQQYCNARKYIYISIIIYYYQYIYEKEMNRKWSHYIHFVHITTHRKTNFLVSNLQKRSSDSHTPNTDQQPHFCFQRCSSLSEQERKNINLK